MISYTLRSTLPLKFIFIFSFFIFLCPQAFAQIAPDKYLVEFTDKNNSPFSILQPQQFLSQRAINRRQQFGIQVTPQDFPVNPSYIQAVLQTGVKFLQQTKWLNAIVIKTIDTAALNQIKQLPFVKHVTKAGTGNLANPTPTPLLAGPVTTTFHETLTPCSPYTHKSDSSFDYGQAYSQIAQLHGQELHESGYKGQGIGIAVLDGGFSGTNTMTVFDSIRNNQQLLGTLNLVGGGTWVYQGTSHGSSVLSIMAANSPGQMIGTAPLADYWLIRTEDISGETLLEEYNWVTGAEYADSAGADIISTSLAYRTFTNSVTSHTYLQTDGNTAPITLAADFAASRGIIVVTSAGNYAQDWSWPHIGFPADADSALTVGAVDLHGIYAPFSSWGPTADGRIKPDVAARGVATFVADPATGFAMADGTSFSTPLIAGLLACLKQAFPAKTNMQLIEAVKNSCSHSSSPDTLTGYGIPDFSEAVLLLTGILDFAGPNEGISLFPNPCTTALTFILPGKPTSFVSLEIYDLQGKSLFPAKRITLSENRGIIENEITALHPGTYLIKITSSERIYFKPIIKQ